MHITFMTGNRHNVSMMQSWLQVHEPGWVTQLFERFRQYSDALPSLSAPVHQLMQCTAALIIADHLLKLPKGAWLLPCIFPQYCIDRQCALGYTNLDPCRMCMLNHLHSSNSGYASCCRDCVCMALLPHKAATRMSHDHQARSDRRQIMTNLMLADGIGGHEFWATLGPWSTALVTYHSRTDA